MTSNMFSKSDNQKYVNYFARAAAVVVGFPLPYNQMSTICDNETIAENVNKLLNEAYALGHDDFFREIDSQLSSVEEKTKQESDGDLGQWYIIAKTICKWMDMKITYESDVEELFSLYGLLERKSDGTSATGAMNDNSKETGVEIHPKYETCKLKKDFGDDIIRFSRFGNRDIFDTLNGELCNVIVFRHNEKLKVNNVIVFPDVKDIKSDSTPMVYPKCINVAFCPMTDKKMTAVLDLESTHICRHGILLNAKRINAVLNEEGLLDRFKNDWMLACKNNADIVFFPEMLGLPKLQIQSEPFNVNRFVKKCCREAIDSGYKTPLLTLLPSYWKDGINSVTVLDRNGMIIGRQKKLFAFVHEKPGDTWQEALAEQNEHEILLIHIPGYHRIVIMICADFLALQNHHLQDILCASLCATLVLVPSYSAGEQDFINILSSLNGYGTTVVWGDCCGAVQSPRVIGGCSIAGADNIKRFGVNVEHGCSCEKCKCCLFMTALPTNLSQCKPNPPEYTDIIMHLRE